MIPTILDVLAPILDVLVVLCLLSAGCLLVWASTHRSRKRLLLSSQYPCRRYDVYTRRCHPVRQCTGRGRWPYIAKEAEHSKGFWEIVQEIESGRRLPLEMENTSRDAVTKVLTDLLLTQLRGIDSYEERANEYPVKKEKTEESILTLMKVADELGLYEDVVKDIGIPQHIKEYYWGPERPNTQRP